MLWLQAGKKVARRTFTYRRSPCNGLKFFLFQLSFVGVLENAFCSYQLKTNLKTIDWPMAQSNSANFIILLILYSIKFRDFNLRVSYISRLKSRNLMLYNINKIMKFALLLCCFVPLANLLFFKLLYFKATIGQWHKSPRNGPNTFHPVFLRPSGGFLVSFVELGMSGFF